MKVFHYKKLRGRIVEKFGSMRNFAHVLGVSENSLSKKMNGKTHFDQRDIVQWCGLLEIPYLEIPLYFFA